MTKELTQQQFRERFQKLPKALQQAVSSVETSNKIFEISKRHDLLIDKTGDLAAETGFLMLGITHPNEFIGNLANRLEIDREKAKAIADDINREIFAPVREHLRGMFGDPEIGKSADVEQEFQADPQVDSEKKPAMNQGKKEGNDNTAIHAKGETSLDDLEKELEKVIADEEGAKPLSVVEKKSSSAVQQSDEQSGYKGFDPYRESVGDDMPNINAKPYTVSKPETVQKPVGTTEINHEKKEEINLETKQEHGVKNIERKEQKNEKLRGFRGINITNAMKEQEVQQDQQQNKAPKDPYRENIT